MFAPALAPTPMAASERPPSPALQYDWGVVDRELKVIRLAGPCHGTEGMSPGFAPGLSSNPLKLIGTGLQGSFLTRQASANSLAER